MSKKLKYLTKLSLNKKIKSKWFIAANIIIGIALIGLINIDSVIKLFGGDFDKGNNIIVIDNSEYLYDEFKNTYDSTTYIDTTDTTIELSTKELKELENNIKDNDIIVELSEDKDNFISAKIISEGNIDTIVYQVITTSLNQVKTNIALNSYGIDKETMEVIETPVDIERIKLDESKSDDELTELLLGVVFPIVILPLFMLILYLVQMIGSEINEEKSTKSMEIIISNVSPEVHFMSKLVSGNVFVIIQAVLMIAYSLIGIIIRFITTNGNILSSNTEVMSEITSAISKLDITSRLSSVIPFTLVLIVITFIAYSLLAGILASMTTNMEDFQQLQTPIMIISLVGFYLSMASSMFEGSLFIRIMSYIPFISSFLSPALLAIGEIGVLDISISILLMIGLVYLLYKYGLKIYKVGILNYSSNKLWKKIFKAMKN